MIVEQIEGPKSRVSMSPETYRYGAIWEPACRECDREGCEACQGTGLATPVKCRVGAVVYDVDLDPTMERGRIELHNIFPDKPFHTLLPPVEPPLMGWDLVLDEKRA